MAFTVGYEHSNVSVDGKPTTYTLRVTHVYRRKDGQCHHHADVRPTSNGTATFPPATTVASGGETSGTPSPRS